MREPVTTMASLPVEAVASVESLGAASCANAGVANAIVPAAPVSSRALKPREIVKALVTYFLPLGMYLWAAPCPSVATISSLVTGRLPLGATHRPPRRDAALRSGLRLLEMR